MWHGARGVPTYFADTVPLGLLLLTCIYLVYRKQGPRAPIVGFISIILTYALLEIPFHIADPGLSEIYFAVILNMFGLVVYCYFTHQSHVRHLLASASLFSAAYIVRQLDQFYCHHSLFEHGTHWMWHLLCACALYFLVQYLSSKTE